MSDTTKVAVGKEVMSLDVSPQFDAYSGVEIIVSDELTYLAGNRNGRVLTIDNPWGTQAQANTILSSLQAKGFQYQPYTAEGAILNPAAEIGDGITISDTYSGLYKIDRNYTPLMAANIEAPQDEEIDHEYPYEPKQDRIYKREIGEANAQISINANAIASEVTARQTADNNINTTLTSKINQTASSINATVTQVSNNKLDHTRSNSSFGWSLTSSAFKINASGSKNVFTATKDGIVIQGNATVTGKIQATSGFIGSSSSNGFAINARGISNGELNADSTDLAIDSNGNYVNGVYISRQRIRLGNNFVVTNTGAVTAKNLALQGGSITIKDSNGNNAFRVTSTGAVTATNLTITGGSIKIGSNFSVSSSGNLVAKSGSFGSLSVSSGGTSYSGSLSGCGGYVSSGLSYGGGSYGSIGSLDSGLSNVVTRVGALEATSITTNNLVAKIANAGTISVSNLVLNGNYVYLRTEAWYDYSGTFHRIYYWGI